MGTCLETYPLLVSSLLWLVSWDHHLNKLEMEVVYMGWTQVGPKGTSELHEEVAQVPTVPISATLPSLTSPVPIASWRVLYD